MRPNPRLLSLALAALLALPAAARAGDDANYGFLRIVEGEATVLSANGTSESAEPNLPLLTGDLLSLGRDARIEAVLADRSRLRLGAGSELQLTAVAFSADGDARQTRLDLRQGSLHLVVTDEALGDELPRVDLDNATVYVLGPGEFRIWSGGGGSSELVVRRGTAEVVTERGSTRVQAGEAAAIEGTRWASTRVGRAPEESGLERWARAAESAAGARQVRYVDSSIGYAAADLDSYGTWVTVDASWAWRPRVAADWRPYWNGRWVYTPSGLTWVSYDPWGWVPHHYGTWTLSPAYGWVWYPGYSYSPAWVYWYWGDRWAGWCPVGYYTRHYRGPSWRFGFHWGHYGWAGGHLGIWRHWSFSPSHRVVDRRDRRRPHWRGEELERELGGPNLPRGLVTTDTRGLDPDRLRQGRLARDLFGERHPGFREAARELPDVTDFVARRTDLPPEVRARIRPTGPTGLRGTPLDPEAAPRRTERQQPGWRAPDRGARLAERPAGLSPERLAPLAPGDGGGRRGTSTEVGERPARVAPGGTGRPGPVAGRPGANLEPGLERPVREAPAGDRERPVMRERPAPTAPASGAPAAPSAAERPDRATRVRGPEGEIVRRDETGGRGPGSAGDGRQNWRFREGEPQAPRAGRGDGGSSLPPPSSGGPSPDLGHRPTYAAPAPGAPRGSWQPADRPVPRPAQPGYTTPEVRRSPGPGSSPATVGERPPVRRVLDGVRQSPGRPAPSAAPPGPSAPRGERASPPAGQRPPQTSAPGSSGSSGSARGGEPKQAPPPRQRGERGG